MEDAYIPLNIDYGEISHNHVQYWWSARGEEGFVAGPWDIPELAPHYSKLLDDAPRLASKPASPLRSSSNSPTRQSVEDPFTKLSSELIAEVMSCLPLKSVNAFRAPSRHVSSMRLHNGFWKSQALSTIPWLFDLPLVVPKDIKDVDWYELLKGGSLKDQVESLLEQSMSLTNRRRICRLCETICDSYEDVEFSAESIPKCGDEFGNVSTSPGRMTAWPVAGKYSTFRLTFGSGFKSLNKPHQLEITATWSRLDAGEEDQEEKDQDEEYQDEILPGLVAISTECDSFECTTPIPGQRWSNENEEFSVTRSVLLEAHDLIIETRIFIGRVNKNISAIVGLEFITKTNKRYALGRDGATRTLRVSDGAVVVGFQGDIRSGLISRLCLLQAQLESGQTVGESKQQRLDRALGSPRSSRSDTTYLWANQALPPGLKPYGMRFGYWNYDIKKDILPWKLSSSVRMRQIYQMWLLLQPIRHLVGSKYGSDMGAKALSVKDERP